MTSCDTFEWIRIVRRATILDITEKGIALILASYADADGTRIFPGTQRLMLVTGRSKSVVNRGVTKLRSAGLIERVSERLADPKKNGRKGEYDEYRLTIPLDAPYRLRMVGPDEDPNENRVSLMTPGAL